MRIRIAVTAVIAAATFAPTAAEAMKPVAPLPDLCRNIEGKQTILDLWAGFYELNTETRRRHDCVRRLILR